MGLEGGSLKGRAIVFALSAGAVAFILSVIRGASVLGIGDPIWHAVIPAVIVATLCWAAAETSIAATASAIDAAIARLSQAARGDLTSAIPAEVGELVPELSGAMTDLFGQLDANLAHVHRLASYDIVTGLPNRGHFRERCDALIADLPADAGSALLFIDLDRFKTINDTLGHAAGDMLLGEVAQRLRDVAGRVPIGEQAPLAGRLAGDEFTIFLPDADAVTAERVGREILTALGAPFEIQGHAVDIGASVGVAMRPRDAVDLTDLMKAADAAMYHAKANGRGRVEHFGAALADRIAERAALDGDLRHAVDRGEFALVFQPQVATGDGQIVAAEALLRWRHPTEGLKLPASFIARAEETGLIVEIGDWAVDEVAATIARWGRAGVAQRLAVNVSPRQIDHAGFFRRLRAAMLAANAPARLLELELTETLAMECSDEVLAALAELRADGATVAIDDFGTGYSNVPRLRALPVDRIKLDPSIVAAVATERAARTIAHALVGLIHGLGCEAVAEGIESAAQADVLRVIGCDAMQGYAIAPPMAEAEFLAWAAGNQPSARASTAA
ncbi:MAG: EAL domain-containing protein [Pseudomonadota bacterium]